MEVESLQTAEIADEVKRLWMHHQIPERDPCINVDLAWANIRRFLRGEKQKQREGRLSGSQGDWLQQLRLNSSPFPTTAMLAELEPEETLTETLEILDAQRARRKVESTLGEAPSRYFFNQLKAKQAKESIKIFKKHDGHYKEKEPKILEVIHRFYSDLFSKDQRVDLVHGLCQDALNLIHNTVSAEVNENLCAVLTDDEIDRIIGELPREKSLGLDGVMAEILQHGWSYMKGGYTEMIRAFWKDSKLTSKTTTGVIKLIPKNQQTPELANWHPLAMLSITEKVVATILACRFKKVVGELVDKQQTGFMADTDIMPGQPSVLQTRSGALLLS